MVRALLLAAVSAVGPAVAVPAADVRAVGPVVPAGTVRTEPAWGWPLAPDPAVVEPFQAPPTPWSAGHRGVDLAAAVGQPVLSDGRGRVTFSGPVAGRGVVVVAHPSGLRSSYEPVDERAPVGTLVVTGSRIGVVADGAGHCRPATCLHWGVRRGDTYLDPLLLLGEGPPVLLPLSPP
ncbi:MAG TPA: peptidoglycan DD-metalloendopeptidase family protein [Actinomycetales bacterium]|nr:peptidoglycan DD-metalloendopeptidase family protein [Actinomycetales bacterium]